MSSEKKNSNPPAPFSEYLSTLEDSASTSDSKMTTLPTAYTANTSIIFENIENLATHTTTKKLPTIKLGKLKKLVKVQTRFDHLITNARFHAGPAAILEDKRKRRQIQQAERDINNIQEKLIKHQNVFKALLEALETPSKSDRKQAELKKIPTNGGSLSKALSAILLALYSETDFTQQQMIIKTIFKLGLPITCPDPTKHDLTFRLSKDDPHFTTMLLRHSGSRSMSFNFAYEAMSSNTTNLVNKAQKIEKIWVELFSRIEKEEEQNENKDTCKSILDGINSTGFNKSNAFVKMVFFGLLRTQFLAELLDNKALTKKININQTSQSFGKLLAQRYPHANSAQKKAALHGSAFACLIMGCKFDPARIPLALQLMQFTHFSKTTEGQFADTYLLEIPKPNTLLLTEHKASAIKLIAEIKAMKAPTSTIFGTTNTVGIELSTISLKQLDTPSAASPKPA